MRILPYIAVMFTLLLAACSGEADKVAKEKMEIAHTLVSQNPDSAMSILEGIQTLVTRECQDSSTIALHALLWTETHYHITKSINDSTLEMSLSYFNNSDEYCMRAKLLNCIRAFRNNQYEHVLKSLLVLEEDIESFSQDWMKSTLESYLASTYRYKELYRMAHRHFKRENIYAKNTGNNYRIANSYINLGVSYLDVNEPDSAFICFTQVLKDYMPFLNTDKQASLYINIGYAIQKFDPDNSDSIKFYFDKALGLSPSTDLKNRTYMLLSEYFYKKNDILSADSLANKVLKESCNPEIRMVMYKTIYEYHNRTGNRDSANLYYRYYKQLSDSAYSKSSSMRIASISLEHERFAKETTDKKRKSNILLIYIICFTSLCVFTYIFIKYKRTSHRVSMQINEYKAEIEYLHKKADLQSQLKVEYEKALNDIAIISNTLNKTKNAKQIFREENYLLKQELQSKQRKLQSLSSQLESNENSINLLVEKIFSSEKDDLKMWMRFLATTQTNILKPILDSYSTLSPERKKSIDILSDEELCLTYREIFICILYKEGFKDNEELTEILRTSVSTFRTAKSRIRKKLINSSHQDFFKELFN